MWFRDALLVCALSSVSFEAGLAKPPLPPADGKPAVNVPEGRELERQIIARDKEFFEVLFHVCDPARMRQFVTDDMEFYHDVEGFAVASAERWVSDYSESCVRRKNQPVPARRELIRDTVVISRIPNYGAVQVGEHQFLERQSDGSEKIVERARFAQLWRLGTDGIWRIARDFSFDHREVK